MATSLWHTESDVHVHVHMHVYDMLTVVRTGEEDGERCIIIIMHEEVAWKFAAMHTYSLDKLPPLPLPASAKPKNIIITGWNPACSDVMIFIPL